MGRRQHHGARAAAGIARAKRIAPAAGHAGGRVAEDRFLLRVADLGVDLAAFTEGEAGAAEHVDVLLFRGQITVQLVRIPQAALCGHRGIGLARDGGQALAAGQRHELGRGARRDAVVEYRAVRTHATAGAVVEVGAAEELGVVAIAPRTDVARADPLAVLAITDLDRVGLANVQAEERVPAVGGQVAGTGGQGGLLGVAVAVTGGAVGGTQDRALEITAQDDVDHAGDGIGAIDRRGAILQHFHAFNGVERDGAQVGEDLLAVIGQAVGGHAAAVQQDQGRARAQAAQRDAGATAGKAVAEGLRDRAGTVGGQGLQVFGDRGLAGSVDFLAGHHLHRGRCFGVGARNVRTGNRDAVQVGGLLLREGGGGSHGANQQQGAAGKDVGDGRCQCGAAAAGGPLDQVFHSFSPNWKTVALRAVSGRGPGRANLGFRRVTK